MTSKAGAIHRINIFLKRKAGMSHAEFRDYYENRHVPLCMKYMAGPVRYFRRYLEPVDGASDMPFDVITELWFEDRKLRDIVLDTMNRDAMPADVIADEMNLFDRAKSRAVAVIECETDLRGAS